MMTIKLNGYSNGAQHSDYCVDNENWLIDWDEVDYETIQKIAEDLTTPKYLKADEFGSVSDIFDDDNEIDLDALATTIFELADMSTIDGDGYNLNVEARPFFNETISRPDVHAHYEGTIDLTVQSATQYRISVEFFEDRAECYDCVDWKEYEVK